MAINCDNGGITYRCKLAMSQDQQKHLRFPVPADRHRQLKEMAARNETTLTGLLNSLIEEYLEENYSINSVETEPELEPVPKRKKAISRSQKKSEQN